MDPRFRPFTKPSSFRQIAASMWRGPNDPTVYGSVDIDATNALRTINRFAKRKTVKLTMTHLVAKALAASLAEHPEINAKVRFWGKLEQRTSIDIFLQITTEGGRDLSGTKIDNLDRKTLTEIADELRARSHAIRAGNDPTYKKAKDSFRQMPWWATRSALALTDFIVNELHMKLPMAGLDPDPFGSAMVTSVGMFGIDTAFAPFPPTARCPIIVLVPKVTERAWVDNGKVVARPVLRLCGTFDHRIIDGFQAGRLSESMRVKMSDTQAWAEAELEEPRELDSSIDKGQVATR